MNLQPSTDPPHPDLERAHRILDGDAEEFAHFIDELLPAAERFASRRLRRPDQVEDVVQAAICKAIENLERYRGEAPLIGWALGICRFEVLATYRGNRSEADQLFDDSLEVEAALQLLRGPETQPEGDVLRHEVAARVHDVLDLLPTRYAQVLRWKYHEDLPVQQIAERLDTSAKAAESTLTRARQAFRKAFEITGLAP